MQDHKKIFIYEQVHLKNPLPIQAIQYVQIPTLTLHQLATYEGQFQLEASPDHLRAINKRRSSQHHSDIKIIKYSWIGTHCRSFRQSTSLKSNLHLAFRHLAAQDTIFTYFVRSGRYGPLSFGYGHVKIFF